MKKIILLISILILLTGCNGVYNLSNFIIPDDVEFTKVIEILDTPEKIGNYMLENFTYETHNFTAQSPYELFLSKKGDCDEFAKFILFIANYHGYETYQIELTFKTTSMTHWIGIYVEDKLSFTNNRMYYYGFDTFREIVEFGASQTGHEWSKYTVYDYDMNIVETGYNN